MASRVVKIAAISGSLRKASSNTGLLRAAVEAATKLEGVEVEILDIGSIPLFNEDLETPELYPPAVTVFREKILTADAILFAAPEYNYSIAAPLKNAIDWGSRQPNVFNDKPAGIVSSGGGMGGGRSQYHLRQCGVFLNLHFHNMPEVMVKRFVQPSPFNEKGDLIDASYLKYVSALVENLKNWTLRLNP